MSKNWGVVIMNITKKIIRRVRHVAGKMMAKGLYRFIPYSIIQIMVGGKALIAEDDAIKMIEEYLPQVNEPELKKILNDMVGSYLRQGAHFYEYLKYGFYRLNERERNDFVTEGNRYNWYNLVMTKETYELFKNKWETYQRFQKYFKRDMICIKSIDDYGSFVDFISRHKKYVYKPLDGQVGRDVKKIVAKENFDIKTRFDSYLTNNCILEELIVQNSEMADLHPASLNTLRISTFLTKDGPVILSALLRMGGNNSFVDNYSAGGLIAQIDIETGIVFTKGIRGSNREYIYHPDTQKQIVGFNVPAWHDAIELVKELATVVPEQRYVGWDIAYSDKGWVMVEGNGRGWAIDQITSTKGVYGLYQKMLEEM